MKFFILLIILIFFSSCKKEKKIEKKRVLTHGAKAIEEKEEKKEVFLEDIVLCSFFSDWDTYLIIRKGKETNLSIKKLNGLYFFKEKWSIARKRKQIIKDISFEVIELKNEGEKTFNRVFPEIPEDVLSLQKQEEWEEDFYHEEKIYQLGIIGDFLSFVHKIDGFTGGAHPYSLAEMKTISINGGNLVDFKEKFTKRDIKKEIRKKWKINECVADFDSIAPFEDRGGKIDWIASFNHSFETCRGMIDFYPVDAGEYKNKILPQNWNFEKNTLKYNQRVISLNVYDFRISPSEKESIILKMSGENDEFRPLWKSFEGEKNRELLYWEENFSSPVFLTRVTEIMTVQWLKNHPRNREIFKLAIDASSN